jgi:mannose-6-phosphate isomerase-like protein (cupin superfamily)
VKRIDVSYRKGFHVIVQNGRSQAASMVLDGGAQTGGPENRHRGADQWLYVVSGQGQAIVNGHSYELETDSLLLIEKGDTHEIRNTGSKPMKTLNFYVPPAYDAEGDELPAGQKD